MPSLQIKMPKCDFHGLAFDVAAFHHVSRSLVYVGLQHRLLALLMCNCVHFDLCARSQGCTEFERPGRPQLMISSYVIVAAAVFVLFFAAAEL